MNDDDILSGGGFEPYSGQSGKFMSKKPGFINQHKNKIVVAGVGVLSIFLIGGAYQGWTNNSKVNEVASQATDNFNPGFQVRYAELGKDVISAYYNGGPFPVHPSAAVTLPDSGASSDTLTESGTNLMKVENITFVSGKKYFPYQSKDWLQSNESSFPDPYREVLNYRATMNGRDVEISISLMVPQIYANQEKALPTLESNPSVSLTSDVSKETSKADGNPSGAGLEPYKLGGKDVNDQLAKFASAWASGDSSALRSLVNDGTDRIYSSPGGMELDNEPKIAWAYKTSFDGDPNNYVVARINFPVSETTEGTKSNGGEISTTEVKFGFEQTMDVLLKMDDKSIPNIVSWGPYWKELTPYSVGKTKAEGAKSSSSSSSSSSSGSSKSSPSSSSSSKSSDTEDDSSTPTGTESGN